MRMATVEARTGMNADTALQRARIFQGFSPEEIAHAAALARQQTFEPGTTIFHEGDPGSYLCIVVDGRVTIHQGDKHIATCRPTEAFGEMAAFGQRRRSATAHATSNVQALLLDETALNHLLDSHLAVPFLLNIIAVLSERLEAGNTWIACAMEARRNAP